MNAKFFLDTNVLLYTFDLRTPQKARLAEELIFNGIKTGSAVISFQVVQEFINAALRRLQPAMSLAEVKRYLEMPLRPLLAVHSSYELYQRAIDLSRRHPLSWYDSLIVAAALEADCRILYTEDLQHGQKFDTLRVQNPFL